MKYFFGLMAAVLVLISCNPTTSRSPVKGDTALANPTQETDLTRKFKGQIFYVPIYSHIYHENENRPFNLAATLSIRNTDLSKEINIISVTYYNTEGKLLKQYLNQPIKLGPLATKNFIVDRRDTSGGSGANFIVEWNALEAVSEPILEAVMVSAGAGQGLSFVSVGRAIKSY